MVLLIVIHPLYLGVLGNFLVVSEPLSKSDALVVLDGDYPENERLLYAVGLWREGYAPRIILSAKLADWMSYEDYPAWRYAMKLKELPPDAVFVVGHDADSTKEEAQKLLPYLREYGFKKIIIVTSNYHTRRARKVFEKAWAGSGIRMSVAAAGSSKFHPDDWWKHRTDSRMFFYEFSKTIWYGLME
jgi:uncharacterized SAM-binding protein YcdF (DUF218 family)